MTQPVSGIDLELSDIAPEGPPKYGRPTYPHLARLIEKAARLSNSWVTREEIINEILLDPEMRRVAQDGATEARWEVRKFAGNIVDWWSSDYTKESPDFAHYRTRFAREVIDRKRAYWPIAQGPSPRVRNVWIRNDQERYREQFPTEVDNSANLRWNLWSKKLPPYNEIEVGDLVVLSWDENKFQSRGKRLGWVIELDHVMKAEYESIEDAFTKLSSEMKDAVKKDDVTKKSFLSDEYSQDKPEPGVLLATSGKPRFLVGVSRPEEIRLARHGWLAWNETDLQRARFRDPEAPVKRYWQVNNNRSSDWETAAGLLFAPSSNQPKGYKDFAEVRVGDVVYAMFDSRIGAKGVVVSAACEVAAGQKSGESEGPGKALSVEFTRLKLPIKPKDHLADIEILSDPARNPLTRFGGAKEPVYFGELADSHAWFYEDLIERSGGVIGAERHLLIRLPESEDGVPSAIDQYRALMRDKGRVALVLDCRVSDKQLSLFSALLHAGKHISVYLLDATAKETLFESRLVRFARYPDSVSSDYIPPIHEPAVQDGNVCLTIDSIDEINLIDQLDELIVFENATNSRVSENLKGRRIMNEVLKVAITGSGQKTGDVATDDDVRELADELSWKPDDLRELLNGITNRRGQVIFSGPPGTGKTYCAERIARFLLAGIEPEEEIEKRVHIVQFHPTYSYQEFVEGLQPEVEDAGFRFAWKDGVLKKICASIESSRSAGTSARHVLIIDEINRANVPSVLGEMMYLLEYRDKNVKLSSGTTFTLPEDLIIIGTMNSADRSIRGLDLALRRRFDFFDLVPEGMAIRKFYSSGGRGKLTGMTVDELVSGFDGLNEEIRKDCQTADLMIGHSYFMEEEMNPRVLSRIWRQQLKPLIREYFLGTIELTSKYETEKSFWKL